MVTYPKDWNETKLLGCVRLVQGLTYTPERVKPYGTLVLRSSNIQNKRLSLLDNVYVDMLVPQDKMIEAGDILVCVRNGSAALIGKSCVLQALPNTTFGAFMSVLRGDTTGFIAKLVESDIVQNQVKDRSNATINQITKKDFESVSVTVPDKPEQSEIAKVLLEIDSYIDNLTELIEKEKAIRDGALEDLVSGRTRLQGFSGEWEEHSFNDFLKIKRGASPRPIEYYVTQNANGVNWIKIGDAPKYGKHILATKEKITESGAMQSVRVYPGDFLLSNSMSFGRPYILRIEGCIHDGWLRLFDFQDTADDEYLYYLLTSDSVQRQYQSYAAGSGVQNLNKEVVKKVVVHLPSLPEQKAIAETLSCIDTEITSLEEEKEKMLQIKAGAMDDLLTGRIRLTRQGG